MLLKLWVEEDQKDAVSALHQLLATGGSFVWIDSEQRKRRIQVEESEIEWD